MSPFLPEFNVWAITSMSCKKAIILTLILINKVVGFFRSFVNIRGEGLRPKHKQRNSYKFHSH